MLNVKTQASKLNLNYNPFRHELRQLVEAGLGDTEVEYTKSNSGSGPGFRYHWSLEIPAEAAGRAGITGPIFNGVVTLNSSY